MITPGYSPTATERVLPRMALDFTTASLDARVTVTRALNTATAINSSGYIQVVNANLPRFDFNPITLACRGLLIEESRANLLLQSADFSSASWIKNNGAITPDATTSPDGTSNADAFIENTTPSVTHDLSQAQNVTTGTAYTATVYIKPIGSRSIMLILSGAAFSESRTWFNLSTLVPTTTFGSVTAASVAAVGNGWYRCTVTQTSIATASATVAYRLWNGSAASYTGDGTSGIYYYGSQLEAGAFATSYIPTTTTSLTRNADVVSMTGTNFSSWYNASEGSFVVVADTAKPTSLASSVFILSADDGTTANRISMRYLTGNAEELVQVSSAVSAQLQKTYVANTAERFAMAYKLDSFAFAANGTAVVTDLLGGLPTVNQLCIGSTASLVQLNGHIGKLMYWPQRLTNAETQAFSK